MNVSANLGAVDPNDVRPCAGNPAVVMALGGALAVALFAAALRGVDGARVLALLRNVGPAAPFLLVPSLLALLLETYAWATAMAASGVAVTFQALFAVRIGSESVGPVLPLGPIWADALKPPLLRERCGVPLSAGVAAIAIRKYLLVLSQAAYLGTAFVLGGAALRDGLLRSTGLPWLAWTPLVAACALAAIGFSTRAVFRGGSVLERLFAAASGFRLAPLRRLAARARNGARDVDAATARFFAAPLRTHLPSLVACYGAWLLESVEAWLLLRALGTHLSWGDVAAVEALVALSRHLLPFVPGGLGIQELGYTMLLAGFGCDGEVSLSLSLAKRLRELFWVTAGGAELLRGGMHRLRTRLAR